MPYINVENSGKGNNKGSCRALVNYLCKENEGKAVNDKEHFFSEDQDQINRGEVIDSIDHNVSKLGKGDSKFFMLTVNFSQREATHIASDALKIRKYTREVMEQYAENFNKGLHSSDLVWYAKIEYSRAFKGFEPEVANGQFRQGDVKPGVNTHVHIVISRKDKTQKLKLSPMTTHRKSSTGIIKSGFDRKRFKVECEKAFDKTFKYERQAGEYFVVANAMKNGSRSEKVEIKQAIYKNQNPVLTTLNLIKGVRSYYPSDEEEKERRRRREKENDQGHEL